INAHAVNGILALIRDFARHPDTPVACLMDGEVGAGKSHVIGTICQRLSADGGAYSFAEVKPLTNPRRPLKHLLGAVVTNLEHRPAGSDAAQLDRITARALATWVRKAFGSKGEALAAQLEQSPGKLHTHG